MPPFRQSRAGKLKPGHGRILTFAIGGKAAFTPTPFGHKDPPVPAMTTSASKDVVHEGAISYGTFCAACHGLNVVAGPLPDLRYATKDVHDHFDDIVMAGARASLGMPSFKKMLTPDQAHAIQAYILTRSAESAKR